jgi:hypothetical protein
MLWSNSPGTSVLCGLWNKSLQRSDILESASQLRNVDMDAVAPSRKSNWANVCRSQTGYRVLGEFARV